MAGEEGLTWRDLCRRHRASGQADEVPVPDLRDVLQELRDGDRSDVQHHRGQVLRAGTGRRPDLDHRVVFRPGVWSEISSEQAEEERTGLI